MGFAPEDSGQCCNLKSCRRTHYSESYSWQSFWLWSPSLTGFPVDVCRPSWPARPSRRPRGHGVVWGFESILGASGIFLCLLLEHLVNQLAVVRLLFDEIAHLGLVVELYHQISTFHVASASRQTGDREGADLLACQKRSQDGTSFYGLGCA